MSAACLSRRSDTHDKGRKRLHGIVHADLVPVPLPMYTRFLEV
jgi:hypothetical protein